MDSYTPFLHTQPPAALGYVDGVRAFIEGRDGKRDKRSSKQARGLRRRMLALGVRTPRHRRRDKVIIPVPNGYVVPLVLAPIWSHPDKVHAAVELLEEYGARITGVELAHDWIGLAAREAEKVILPGLVLRGSRVCQWTDSRPRGRALGIKIKDMVYVVTVGDTTTYFRRRKAARNLVCYADRPSKLDPCGPPVFHVELRLRGAWLNKQNLREPRELLRLLQTRKFKRIWDKHVVFVDLDPAALHCALNGRKRRLRILIGRPPHDSQRALGERELVEAAEQFHQGSHRIDASAHAVDLMLRQIGRSDLAI